MKILLAHNFYQQPGGEDTVFHQEVNMLRAAGHDVVAYTRTNKEIEQFGWVDKAMLFPRTIWSLRSQSEFGELLDRERPSLVHFHNTFMLLSPAVYAACKDRRVPVVQTLHNYRLCCPGGAFFRNGSPCEDCTTKGLLRGVRNKCYRNSHLATATVASMIAVNRAAGTWRNLVDCYIALTNFARDKMAGSGIPAHKIHVKPNFVSPDPGGRASSGDYALFVGRLVVEKGVSTLLSAWHTLGARIPLRIIGDGPQHTNLRRFQQVLNVPRLEMLGQLPRKEVLEQIRSARFLIFPSECYENFPMTIVEAFACGVPVIAASIGAAAEIVHNGETGLTFQPGNPDDLARCVNWAVDHPRELEAMGVRARSEFESRYTAQHNYQLLMNIYRTALNATPVLEPVAVPEALRVL